jgi:hypothetical protein
VVGIVLRQQGAFYVLDHYPKGDVFDPESHAQWYYHAHDKKERPGEHGHFHTFMRGGGMPEGVAPEALPDFQPKKQKHDLVSHLIAVSMDRSGWPIGLFTTNRWVTGETWYPARDVAAMLDGFEMRMDQPSWAVNRWLTALLRLFRPQIEALLRQRDARVRAWRRQHPDANAYEDRRLEVTSHLAIDVEAQVPAREAPGYLTTGVGCCRGLGERAPKRAETDDSGARTGFRDQLSWPPALPAREVAPRSSASISRRCSRRCSARAPGDQLEILGGITVAARDQIIANALALAQPWWPASCTAEMSTNATAPPPSG